jgi:hypothetical protein
MAERTVPETELKYKYLRENEASAEVTRALKRLRMIFSFNENMYS